MAITTALLGLGRMGQLHANTLARLPDITLKAVYDPLLTTCPPTIPSHLLTHDLKKILNDSEITCCIIATPSSTHSELIEACARAGKHIFCEKPISFHNDTLEKLATLLKQTNTLLQVGFNRRFDPHFQEVSARLNRHEVGDIHVIKITNRDPKRTHLNFVKDSGGLFFDFSIHDFDMLHFLTGAHIQEIYVAADALIDPQLKDFNDTDTALISLKLSNGALAVIDCSRETGYGYDQRLEIFGSKGMINLPNITENTLQKLGPHGQQSSPIYYSFIERFKESYFYELKSFFTCVQNNIAPSPTIYDTIKALKVAQAASQSYATNRSVALDY